MKKILYFHQIICIIVLSISTMAIAFAQPPDWYYYSPQQIFNAELWSQPTPSETKLVPTLEDREGTVYGKVWQLAAPSYTNTADNLALEFNQDNATLAGNEDGSQGITAVYRVTGINGIVTDPNDNPPKAVRYWPELRLRNKTNECDFRPNVEFIDLGMTGIVINRTAITDGLMVPLTLVNGTFVTFRITFKGNLIDVYVNEEETPLIKEEPSTRDATEFRLLIGDSSSNQHYIGEIEWVAFTLAGAFSPSQRPLPELLRVPTSTKKIPVSGTFLYPNPTDGILKISTDQPVNVKGYSVTGALVLDIQNASIIDISNQPSGCYFFRITGESFTETVKVMKK